MDLSHLSSIQHVRQLILCLKDERQKLPHPQCGDTRQGLIFHNKICSSNCFILGPFFQVVIGSFTPNGYKPHKRKYTRRQGIAPAPAAMGGPDAVQGAAPISQLKPDHAEISFAQAEPDCKTDEFEPIEIPNTDTPDTEEEWDDPEPALTPDQGPYPDINVSVPGD